MPISFQLAGNLIWVTLSGHYSLEEMRQTSDAILQHPTFQEGLHLLLDARQAKVNPNLSEIR